MFTKKRDNFHNHLIGILALGGTAVMTYLTRLHFLSSGGAICSINEKFSCEIVNKSHFSEMLGVPIAVLGLLFFLSVLYIIIVKPVRQYYRIIFLFSVFSLVFGLYLSAIEQFVLDSICLFCELSKIFMVGLIFASWHAMKMHRGKLPSIWIIITILSAIVFTGISYAIQA